MADDTTSEPAMTPDEYADAKRRTAAYEAQQVADAKAARDEKLAPLRAIVGTDAYAQLCTDIAALVRSAAYVDDQSIDIHLRAAHQVLPNLKAAAQA